MRVSVALCTYNGAAFLPEQLDSLVRQERRPDELVACDDGSTDGTADLLTRFAAVAPFPVRVVVNDTRLGVTRNFERAISLCTGDVIALADQDDSWLPDKLARMGRVFAGEPGVGLVTGDAWLTGPNLERTGRRFWPTLPFPAAARRRFEAGDASGVLLRYNVVAGATTAFRADLRSAVLPIPAGWFHDYWIASVVAAVAGVRLLPDPIIRYRQHPGQQVGADARGLVGRIRSALRITRAGLEDNAERVRELRDRLQQFTDRLRSPEILPAVEAKLAHAELRAAMRGMNRARRAAVAGRELLAGRYHRFGRGWRVFAADVFLA